MSTLKTNNVQVGQSVTATNNFTLYQPSSPDGTVRLGVGNTGATTLDVITATSAGNVGIGTTSPAGKFQTKVATDANVAFDNDGGTARLDFFNDAASANVGGVIQSSSLIFKGSSGAERARIDSSGNFLFNKTSTAASGSGVCFQTNDTSQFYRGGDGQAIQFFRSSSQVGSISVTGTNTAFNTSSDYRLKHNVQPMTGALARVTALKPCTYKWNLDNSDGEGFIAHELAEVVPGCVTGEKDAVDEDGNIKPQGIDTSFLVATLTAAIQEQQALIASLTARIAALEGAQP
jgi:hypothetical protein